MKSPCCNAKTTQGKGKLLRCSRCGGSFDPVEIASGRIEGGTYGHRPDMRLIQEEEGGPRGSPIDMKRPLKGGFDHQQGLIP